MKINRAVLLLFFCAAVASCVVIEAAFGQDGQLIDGRPIEVPPGTVLRQLYHIPGAPSAAGSLSTQPSSLATTTTTTTMPLWHSTITSPIDGITYPYYMVGTDPSVLGAGSTTVPTVLIPVRLNFKYNPKAIYVFDPTQGDPGCIGSGNTASTLTQNGPIFQNFDYILGGTDVGTTQYTDAFQRANFWSQVSLNSGYHTLLGLTVKPVQSVTVTSSDHGSPNGAVYTASGQCGNPTGLTNHAGYLGVMNINFWDPVAQSLLTKLGIGPDKFAIFLFYNAAMSQGNPTNINNCCILGYHNAIGSLSSATTYAVADFEGRNQTLFGGVADITPLSHEVAEWMDDPLVNISTNSTPAWGQSNIFFSNCQSYLEDGDPLAGTPFPSTDGMTMNGFTYHPQELVFFSWFFRENPSRGVNGWFSNNGSFTGDAGPVCQ